MVRLNIVNGNLVQTPFDENLPIIELTDVQYNKVINGELKFKNGELVINNQARIDELKQCLFDTDYQAIKYAEGQLTEQQYAQMKAQRQAWRDEINQLETE